MPVFVSIKNILSLNKIIASKVKLRGIKLNVLLRLIPCGTKTLPHHFSGQMSAFPTTLHRETFAGIP